VNLGRNDRWSSPDADGIMTCNLDVGAISTLRGRRKRRAITRRLTEIALWPASWRELVNDWLKHGGPRRKWEGLMKSAGGGRANDAWQLLDSMLKAGFIEIEERRTQNRWQPLWVEFIDQETMREAVGLPNRQELQKLIDGHLKFVFQNYNLDQLQKSLSGMPLDRAVRRHRILEALDGWIREERNGTRRDFAHYALGDTKGVSPAEWSWLENTLSLEELGIFKHTPAIWLRAPLSFISSTGCLNLRGVPDCIGLTPETLKHVVTIEGEIERWRLLENRTVFERTARRRGAEDGVVWTPGFAPDWWKESVAKILELCPAPALIACDPDPAGIEIALDVGWLWTGIDLKWEPWCMDVATLSGINRKKSIGDDDRDRLNRLLSKPMPESLKQLAIWMLENGVKGEQEGISF
jgi:hypothetical protein